MKKLLFASLFCSVVYSLAFAQDNSLCPKMSVESPATRINPGDLIEFLVPENEETKNLKLSYRWTVSAGKITQGLKNNSIEIDTEGLAGFTITVKVEIKGFPKNCPNKFFTKVSIEKPTLNKESFDRYGKISFWQEQARLDNFMIQLKMYPKYNAIVYLQLENTNEVVVYTRISQILKYFIIRKFPIKNRSVFIVSKSGRESTIIYFADKNYKNFECEDCQIIKGSEINLLLKNKQAKIAKRNH